MRYGQDGAPLPNERKMMTDGLAGSLALLPASTTQRIAVMSAPMMAAFGFTMYLSRLSSIEVARSRETAEQSAVNAAEQLTRAAEFVQPTANGTGHGHNTFRPEDLQAPSKTLLDDLQDKSGGI
jgi:hypothetical protein